MHSDQFQTLGAEDTWMLNHSARKPLPFYQKNDNTWTHFILVGNFLFSISSAMLPVAKEILHWF